MLISKAHFLVNFILRDSSPSLVSGGMFPSNSGHADLSMWWLMKGSRVVTPEKSFCRKDSLELKTIERKRILTANMLIVLLLFA